MKEYRFLLSWRWLVAAALVVVFGIACHFLSQWQLARRAEAQAEIARVANNYDAPATPIETALPQLADFDMSQKWMPVQLSGHYLSDSEVVVRNRPCHDASGYAVLTPFQLDSGGVFIVNRGCVPAADNVNAVAQYAAAPIGAQTVVVHLLPGEPIVSGRLDTASSVGSINLSTLAERTHLSLYTGAYGTLVATDPLTAPYPADRPTPDEGPHLSYALQWYIFALIAVVVYIWAARQEAKRRREDHAADTEQVAGSSEPRSSLSERYGESGTSGRKLAKQNAPVRQSRDDEYEDSLIDAANDH